MGPGEPAGPGNRSRGSRTRCPRVGRARVGRAPWYTALVSRWFVTATTQVALELAGDGVTAGFREIRGVLGLFEGTDVLRHLIIGLRQLVHSVLPRPRLLGKLAARDGQVEQLLQLGDEPEGGFG